MEKTTKLSKQEERIFNYMRVHGSINPLEAWVHCGVYRLASRICDLKRHGIPVKSVWINERNKFGEKVKIKRYMLT